jgi:hypothetical protein
MKVGVISDIHSLGPRFMRIINIKERLFASDGWVH